MYYCYEFWYISTLLELGIDSLGSIGKQRFQSYKFTSYLGGWRSTFGLCHGKQVGSAAKEAWSPQPDIQCLRITDQTWRRVFQGLPSFIDVVGRTGHSQLCPSQGMSSHERQGVVGLEFGSPPQVAAGDAKEGRNWSDTCSTKHFVCLHMSCSCNPFTPHKLWNYYTVVRYCLRSSLVFRNEISNQASSYINLVYIQPPWSKNLSPYVLSLQV